MASATEPKKTKSAFEFLAPVSAAPIGVDEPNKRINGIVVAQQGPFKSGRGEFDATSNKQTADLINADPQGIKARMGHPNPQHPGSKDELLGFVGRYTNGRVDGELARADLQLDPVAFLAPPGGGTSHGDYLMTRAKSDPASLSTSMVVSADKQYRLDNHAKPKRDPDTGEALPPLWRPQQINAIDFVDEGDATGGALLAPPANFDVFQQAAEAMDAALDGLDQQTIGAFLNLYLTSRFVCKWAAVLGEDDDEFGASLSAVTKRETALALAVVRERVESLAAKKAESAAKAETAKSDRAEAAKREADADEETRLRWANKKRKGGK
jgi:hypothetical protein